MTFISDLTTLSADAMLQILTELGTQVDYTDNSGTYTLYGIPDTIEVVNQNAGNAIGDLRDRATFVIPRQTNFAPTTANACNDKLVTWNTVNYRVVNTIAGAVDGVYRLECEALHSSADGSPTPLPDPGTLIDGLSVWGNPTASPASGTSILISDIAGAVGPGVAAGGVAGNILTKVDGTDYNTQWSTQGTGGGVDVDTVDGQHATAFAVAAKGVTNGDSHDHSGGDGAQIDHGGLGGLADDDHTQYHNDGRGDARYSQLGHNHNADYAPLAKGVTNGDSHDHSGGDGGAIDYTNLSNIPANFAPSTHASSHATLGSDPIAPADIGAAATAHTHTQAQSHGTPDTDTATTALHHTLGTGANQAAAGNHNHAALYAPIAKGVTNGDSHNHDGGDGGTISHTALTDIGTNTHAQIDTALTNASAHTAATGSSVHGLTGTAPISVAAGGAVSISAASGAAAGSMSAAHYTKLEGIAASAAAVADLTGTAETLGGSAVVGAATTAARSDHKHAITNPKIDDLAAGDDNTDLNASTSAHGLAVKAVAPAANVLNVVGIGNGETAYTNKSIFDGTNPAALGSAAPGTSLIAAHRDHVHAMPSHTALSDIGTNTHAQIDTHIANTSNPHSVTAAQSGALPTGTKLDDLAAPDNNTDLDASTTAHGLVVKATAPAAGTLNVVGIGNGETTYTCKTLFDSTSPADLGTAAAGTSLYAAHRDHVHNIPSLGNSTNYLINGGFDIWQRTGGASTNPGGDDKYCADRWVLLNAYDVTYHGTHERDVGTDDNVSSSAKICGAGGGLGTTRSGLLQIVESYNAYALRGRSVRFQCRAKVNAGTQNFRAAIISWTGTADSPTSDVVNDWSSGTFTAGNFFIAANVTIDAVSGDISVGTSYTDVYVTGTVSASATNVMVFVWPNGDFDDYWWCTKAGLYDGTSVQSWLPRPIEEEQSLCERYYEYTTAYIPPSTATVVPASHWRTQKRVVPSISGYGAGWVPYFVNIHGFCGYQTTGNSSVAIYADSEL